MTMFLQRAALVMAALTAADVRGADEPVSYNRDIRPLLSDNCFACHGPATKKAGLRLDVFGDASKPARSGRVPIVPGKPGESEVIARIFAADKDAVMPPPGSHKTLKAHEKALLKTWIAQGAVYQKHWSFEPPQKVAAPANGFSNPIDAFIVARLQKEKLKLAPEADRPTLIRRVAFALTGLPPTLAEVEAYLADSSPRAYEAMVDRYLESKHFGEEMARHWLDIARYGDTHGLHLDNERQMWLYRDWVVKAFNSNLPFDRFTVEQVAGDLLPSATSEQLTATGFNRCNVTTGEGGSIDQEWVFRNAVDRTSTMMQAWLGLTGGCAVCHDHKFDPISAKEYYSLYSFFYSVDGPALDGNKLLTEPVAKVPLPEQNAQLQEIEAKIAKARQDLAEKKKAAPFAEPTDEKKQADPLHSFQAWLKENAGKDVKGAPAAINGVLKKAVKLTPESETILRDYFVEYVCADTKPIFLPLNERVIEMTKQRDALNGSIPGTFIFKETAPRPTFVMMRGAYNKPGAAVEPNTPEALPPLKKAGARATRLDLANWLVAPENPLTARVAVNRFWQQFFGTGLVPSSDEFGTQGQLPSHPELLDTLAVGFREQKWDVKALTRLMLTSATFRQASNVSPDLLKRDPDNVLYARGPRFRLDAEQLRDNALFVSGLMNPQMGGRGVRPYQPPRIWEPVAFVGSNTGNYTQDKGPALYRRSIYVFFKRTAPPPFMVNFDAPNRESLCSRRERSNTPLQALQLMNDVQHVEAARALAERIVTEGGKTPAERIRFAYRVVLARLPEAAEAELVAARLQKYLERYTADPTAAGKLIRYGDSPPRPGLSEPEIAAYTMIANLLLNLDETVTRN
ncbi:MAG: PSD1 and planctomycete cytochrome C domain-containing protein [Planctomycetota bacterium]